MAEYALSKDGYFLIFICGHAGCYELGLERRVEGFYSVIEVNDILSIIVIFILLIHCKNFKAVIQRFVTRESLL